ncbi:hypothetical protein ACOMHN_044219 [Nucella lapillus]
MCKVAGVLSLLSSEVSALIIWIITLDRFVVIHFPFSTVRFNTASAAVACLLIWLVGWCLALAPLLPVTSHWNFYGQTGGGDGGAVVEGEVVVVVVVEVEMMVVVVVVVEEVEVVVVVVVVVVEVVEVVVMVVVVEVVLVVN